MSDPLAWGNCPVQGEGFIDGHPWYFRARYESWAFTVGEHGAELEAAVMVGWPEDVGGVSGWGVKRPWIKESEFAAGWMPRRHANRLISICLRWFREGRLERIETSNVSSLKGLGRTRERPSPTEGMDVN